MGHILALAVVALLIVAAVLQLMGWRRFSCWPLALFPASICVAALLDLSHGAAKIGAGAYASDQKQLPYCLAFLVLSVVPALRPQWNWLFWVAWVFNAFVCAFLVYVAFFWKVFS
jgi:hypothetical protein